MSRQHQTDVIVLGSGLAGSIAALCLSRHGLRTTVLDQGVHPRFALGESTTTPSSLWLRVLAERFGVPELLNLASAEALTRNVATTSGVKSNFGFLYHRPGDRSPARSWQAIIPQAYLADQEQGRRSSQNEMHYFRQDVDAYLWATALASGVEGWPSTTVASIDLHADGVRVTTECGRELQGRFLIDASGYRSPLASRLGLRDPEPRLRTNSRSIFTHMVGVRPFEDLGIVDTSMAPWSQGTLHHFFDGGWAWVIPFDNHTGSLNPLCSVGLNLDNRRFPKRAEVSPEDEWAAFLRQYPGIAEQFAQAVPVRPWVDTGRLQYTSSTCVGDRFWLTSHAAGAVDALYSMGNINTFQTLATGLSLVARCFDDGRFDRDRLEPIHELTEALFGFQDRIVYGNYASFRSPDLLQTWIALWSLTDTGRIRHVLAPLVRYFRTRDRSHLDFCVDDPATILTGLGMRTGIADTPTVLRELDVLCDIMLDFERGVAAVPDTAARLRRAIEGMDRYAIDLRELEQAFSTLPWAFEPLAKNHVRAHGLCFLTPHELNTLGTEADGAP